MIYWAPLLHFYQPPTQTPAILKKVTDEAYLPILDVFEEYPYAGATFNINGVLTEMLALYGHTDVLERMRALAGSGRVEFTGSGKYHPILPLIPSEEVERQIRLNLETNRQHLGESYSPQGFFTPEMCYSAGIVNPLVESRHGWVILSGVACPAAWPTNVIYGIDSPDGDLAVFFRDDILSNKISFRDIDGKGFIEHLKGIHRGEGDIYVITAMDAETFGHHIRHWDRLFLSQAYETIMPSEEATGVMCEQKPLGEQHRRLFEYEKSGMGGEIRTVTISRLLELFPRGAKLKPHPSSWSTSADDIRAGNYYPLWKDRNNPVHAMQWDHLNLTIEVANRAFELADGQASRDFAGIARAKLDEALHSCQFWWASKRPMWDINMIYRGLTLQREVLLNAYKAIQLSNCPEALRKDYYYRVVAARHIFDQVTDYLYTD